MTIISNGREITLNESQLRALDSTHEFLEDRNKLFFCLSGSAGTGKTTIMKEALKNESSVCVTAPTHKAKKVIAVTTGFTAKTIHSILGLRPNTNLEEFTHQSVQFSLIGNSVMEEFALIVIDESSMLNKDLLELIKCKAKEFNIKVLFMGDANQLPPVKETVSKVFFDPEITQCDLTIVERQAVGNPLILLYDEILTNINSKTDNYAKISNFKEDEGLGFKFISDSSQYTDLLCSKFDFVNGNFTDNKMMAWTNNKVKSWNNLIRNHSFGKPRMPLQVGEFLMAYRTVTDLVNWKILKTENSCEYKVTSIKESSKEQMWQDGTKKDRWDLINGYNVGLENLDTGRCDTVFIVDKSSYDIFSTIDAIKSNWAKNAKAGQERGYAWKMYYEFRDRFFLLGDICNESGQVMVAKDLDFAYAITVHKSQGSTYDNVFVDENNLDEFWDKKMTREQNYRTRNSLKYVAFSRPRYAAFIWNRK